MLCSLSMPCVVAQVPGSFPRRASLTRASSPCQRPRLAFGSRPSSPVSLRQPPRTIGKPAAPSVSSSNSIPFGSRVGSPVRGLRSRPATPARRPTLASAGEAAGGQPAQPMPYRNAYMGAHGGAAGARCPFTSHACICCHPRICLLGAWPPSIGLLHR